MLLLPRAVRILLAAEPVDLRNSIDGLAALVRNGWKENVYAGHLFVFISRRRNRVKILAWDNGGFVVFYKRLEQGRFLLPKFHDDALGAQLDATQLALLLDGVDVATVRRPRKWSPPEQQGDRQISAEMINPQKWRPAGRRTRASGGTKRRSSAASSTPRGSGRRRSRASSKH